MIAEPFIKWVGSKRWLVSKVSTMLHMPTKGCRAFVPFLGGGSVAFYYANVGASLHMSDRNQHLVNLEGGEILVRNF